MVAIKRLKGVPSDDAVREFDKVLILDKFRCNPSSTSTARASSNHSFMTEVALCGSLTDFREVAGAVGAGQCEAHA